VYFSIKIFLLVKIDSFIFFGKKLLRKFIKSNVLAVAHKLHFIVFAWKKNCIACLSQVVCLIKLCGVGGGMIYFMR
jgi:hypothetical protein